MENTHHSFNVPVKLLGETLKRGLQKELKMFFLLKSLTKGGKVKKNRELREYICSTMKFRSEKTFYNYVNRLYDMYWIGESHGNIYVRSTKRICESMQIYDMKNVAELIIDIDLENFDEFLFSARVIFEVNARESRVVRLKGGTNPALRGKRRKLTQKGKDLKKRRTNQSFTFKNGETFSIHNMSISYIAEFTGLSRSRVHELKKRSRSCGYIEYVANYFSTPVPALKIEEFKKQYPQFAHRSFVRGDKVVVRMTDSIDAGRAVMDIYGYDTLQ